MCTFELMFNLFVYPGEVLPRKCGHKQHMCVYCEKWIWNVSRHLSSSNRRNAWKRMTRLVDFDANIKLMKDYKEPLFVVRKREAKPDKEEELPCKSNGKTFCLQRSS